MADAQIGHLCYNMGRKMKGAHHDGHAYPPKKAIQIMSEKQEKQTPRKTSYMGLGLAIGIAIGAGLEQRHEQNDAYAGLFSSRSRSKASAG